MSDQTPREAKKQRFNDGDWKRMGEQVGDELTRRQTKRADKEKKWKEVDRQVNMEARPLYESDQTNHPNAWMSNVELPLQAITLETNVADIRRMSFPNDRSWYRAHGAVTDDWLRATDFQSLLPGDDSEIPSTVGQAEANAIIKSSMDFYHSQYNFRAAWDALNGEANKYGTFAGRLRVVEKHVFVQAYRGVLRQKKKLPILIPRSMWSTYLDDSLSAVMNEGMLLAPAIIEKHNQKLADIKMAAMKGSSDPKNMLTGGWRKDAVKTLKLKNKTTKEIEIAEYEGDMVLQRDSGRPMFLPNSLITVAFADDGTATTRGTSPSRGATVIRYRISDLPFRSYITQEYHSDDVTSAYGVGPLMLGCAGQKGATEAFNDLMDSAKLKSKPPINYDPDDFAVAAQGGPILEPHAVYPSKTGVKALDVGSPELMVRVFMEMRDMYRDTTGTQKPRLGAQAKSHTTASSAIREETRGLVRTVDYVSDLMSGAIPTWLSMEYEIIKTLLEDETVFVKQWNSFIKVSAKHLPEHAVFEVFGAGGPFEEAEQEQKRAAALNTLLTIEPQARELGGTPINIDEVRRSIMEEAGIVDTERILPFSDAGGDQGGADGPPVEPEPGDGSGLVP